MSNANEAVEVAVAVLKVAVVVAEAVNAADVVADQKVKLTHSRVSKFDFRAGTKNLHRFSFPNLEPIPEQRFQVSRFGASHGFPCINRG